MDFLISYSFDCSRSSIGVNWTEQTSYCTSLRLSFFQYNMDKAIVDSGTTLLRLPVNVFNAVVEAIARSSLVGCRVSTDRCNMLSEQRDTVEKRKHSLLEDIVAAREKISAWLHNTCSFLLSQWYFWFLFHFKHLLLFVAAHKQYTRLVWTGKQHFPT